MERLYIWGDQIPGNSSKEKISVMEVKKRLPGKLWATIKFFLGIGGTEYRDTKQAIDTFTMCSGVASGAEKRTFEDEPYLVPFIAEGSTKAVIVVPGGGYGYKSMDTDFDKEKNESSAIAKRLQESGITAFVLWYRSNPYYQPIPLMDMQRAVRYVRFHAKDYGYREDQIGAIGFSAGGMQTSLFLNVYKGTPVEMDGYIPDAIDTVDDSLNFAAHIYPCLSYKYMVPMMFASFPGEEVRNPVRRTELLDQYDSIGHFNSAGIPQFLCHGTKDILVDPAKTEEYAQLLQKTNTPYKFVRVDGANHGFGSGADKPEKIGYWVNEFVDWLGAI